MPEAIDHPDGFSETIAKTAPDEGFAARLEQTARTGHELALLREEARQIGFQPMTLERYGAMLAKAAGVDWTRLKARLGLTEGLTPDTALTGRAVSRLAAGLGLGFHDAKLMLRIGLMEQSVPSGAALLGARPRGHGAERARIARLLDEAEATYGPEDRLRLARMQSVLEEGAF